MIVLMVNLAMTESSEVKKFMEPLQAGNDHFNVIELMDIGFHLLDFVASKAIVNSKCDDDEHWMWKSAMSHLVMVILDLNGVQFE